VSICCDLAFAPVCGSVRERMRRDLLSSRGCYCRRCGLMWQPPPAAPREPYCWEDGGDEDAPMTKRLWHTLHWSGVNIVSGT
jgi:hypothetical protein